MSRYILKPEYGLRSYNKLPSMLAVREEPECSILLKSEWEFLIKCDGKTEIEMDEKLQEWFNSSRVRSMVKEAEPGDELSSWQKNILHDNLYFPALEWRITDRCNFNCLHCYNAADESANAAMWSLEDAYEFLDQVSDAGILELRLSGGEPMLHKDFLKIYKAIYDRGMYVGQIVTNGFYITQEILDEIASYGKKPLFKVSFDGFGYHDWMRDYKGAEKSAVAAFELLAENGFPILVNAQINRKNKDSFVETMEYFDKLGVETLRFIRTTEVPRWVLKAGDAAMPYPEYYETMLEILREYSSKPRKMDLILWAFGLFFPQKKQFRMINNICSEGNYRDSLPTCQTIRKQICVTAAGNIYPCSQMSGECEARGLTFGNVMTDGLQNLLKEGSYVDFTTMTAGEIKAHNEKCAACSRFKQCIGGCRALGWQATGSFYGGNPAMCELAELDYETKVQDVLVDWKNITASSGHKGAEENGQC